MRVALEIRLCIALRVESVCVCVVSVCECLCACSCDYKQNVTVTEQLCFQYASASLAGLCSIKGFQFALATTRAQIERSTGRALVRHHFVCSLVRRCSQGTHHVTASSCCE